MAGINPLEGEACWSSAACQRFRELLSVARSSNSLFMTVRGQGSWEGRIPVQLVDQRKDLDIAQQLVTEGLAVNMIASRQSNHPMDHRSLSCTKPAKFELPESAEEDIRTLLRRFPVGLPDTLLIQELKKAFPGALVAHIEPARMFGFPSLKHWLLSRPDLFRIRLSDWHLFDAANVTRLLVPDLELRRIVTRPRWEASVASHLEVDNEAAPAPIQVAWIEAISPASCELVMIENLDRLCRLSADLDSFYSGEAGQWLEVGRDQEQGDAAPLLEDAKESLKLVAVTYSGLWYRAVVLNKRPGGYKVRGYAICCAQDQESFLFRMKRRYVDVFSP